jgi:ribonuclease P protein component
LEFDILWSFVIGPLVISQELLPKQYTFPKTLHLRTPAEFAAVYDAKVRESRGPLLIYALPNDLGHPRIGLSTSRKVGTAPRRNHIRRMLREAFRLMRHDLPRGYDFVIVVRAHEPLMLADYQRVLSGAAVKLHNAWQRRSASAVPTRECDPSIEGDGKSTRAGPPGESA